MASRTDFAVSKASRARRGHDRERRRLGTDDAARDRCVDEAAPRRRDARRDRLDGAGRAGRHQRDDRILRERVEGAAGEEDRLGLRRIDDHQDENVGAFGRGRERRSARAAHLTEAVHRGRPDIEAAYLKSARDEVLRHGEPHGAESDEADDGHVALLTGTARP